MQLIQSDFMELDNNHIAQKLIKRGNFILKSDYEPTKAAGDPENPGDLKDPEFNSLQIEKANDLINNLKAYPHAFVLACIMDTGVKSKRAWQVPYRFSQVIGGFDFERLLKLEKSTIADIFNNKNNNFGMRYPNDKAKYFHCAILRIHENYNDDASRIWANKPPSSEVVRNFLGFKGIGIKIATMAANILVREFKIEFQDKRCIDISPDIHVMRVFSRLGLISKDAKIEELNYCARQLYPKYPGVFDFPAWEIGTKLCRPKNPDCINCYLNDLCPKII